MALFEPHAEVKFFQPDDLRQSHQHNWCGTAVLELTGPHEQALELSLYSLSKMPLWCNVSLSLSKSSKHWGEGGGGAVIAL